MQTSTFEWQIKILPEQAIVAYLGSYSGAHQNGAKKVDFSFQLGMAWFTGYSPLYVLALAEADAVPLKNQYQQKNSCDFWMLIFFGFVDYLLLRDTSHTRSQSPVKVKFHHQ